MQIASRSGALAPTNDATLVNRLAPCFDGLQVDVPAASLMAEPELAMPLSIWDDEENVFVEMDVPGMEEKDLEITIEPEAIIIRGERKCTRHECSFDTRIYGQFEHRLRIPVRTDADGVEAHLANGVLSVRLPKGA